MAEDVPLTPAFDLVLECPDKDLDLPPPNDNGPRLVDGTRKGLTKKQLSPPSQRDMRVPLGLSTEPTDDSATVNPSLTEAYDTIQEQKCDFPAAPWDRTATVSGSNFVTRLKAVLARCTCGAQKKSKQAVKKHVAPQTQNNMGSLLGLDKMLGRVAAAAEGDQSLTEALDRLLIAGEDLNVPTENDSVGRAPSKETKREAIKQYSLVQLYEQKVSAEARLEKITLEVAQLQKQLDEFPNTLSKIRSTTASKLADSTLSAREHGAAAAKQEMIVLQEDTLRLVATAKSLVAQKEELLEKLAKPQATKVAQSKTQAKKNGNVSSHAKNNAVKAYQGNGEIDQAAYLPINSGDAADDAEFEARQKAKEFELRLAQEKEILKQEKQLQKQIDDASKPKQEATTNSQKIQIQQQKESGQVLTEAAASSFLFNNSQAKQDDGAAEKAKLRADQERKAEKERLEKERKAKAAQEEKERLEKERKAKAAQEEKRKAQEAVRAEEQRKAMEAKKAAEAAAAEAAKKKLEEEAAARRKAEAEDAKRREIENKVAEARKKQMEQNSSPSQQPPAPAPSTNESEVLKIDPMDGKQYTFAGIQNFYKNTYSLQEIDHYWNNTMIPADSKIGKKPKSRKSPKKQAQ